MIHTILEKIGAALITVAITVGGLFAPKIADLPNPFTADRNTVQNFATELENAKNELSNLNEALQESQHLGADTFNFVAGQQYRLAGSGIGISDTSIALQSFKQPVSGTELSMADFGTIGYATLEPFSATKKEFVSFTGITQDGSSDRATLTGITRGLAFVAPYTASSSLRLAHSGGSILVISNPPQLYNQLAAKGNDETISGIWTFGSTTIPRLDGAYTYVAGDELKLVTYGQLASTSFSGTVDASITQKGIVEEATKAEIAAGSTTGDTTAHLFIPASAATSSCDVATTSILVTQTTGKVKQSCLNLSEAYTWTGGHTFSTTTTFNATSTFTSGVTIPATTAHPVSLNGVAYTFPSVDGSANNVLSTNGSKVLSWSPLSSIVASTSDVTWTGATTIQTFSTSSVPANTYLTNKGIHGAMYWSWTNLAAGNVATTTITYGGTDIVSARIGSTNGNNTDFVVRFDSISTGVTNGQETRWSFTSNDGFSTSSSANLNFGITSAVDSTSAQNIVVRGQMNNSGNNLILREWWLDAIK